MVRKFAKPVRPWDEAKPKTPKSMVLTPSLISEIDESLSLPLVSKDEMADIRAKTINPLDPKVDPKDRIWGPDNALGAHLRRSASIKLSSSDVDSAIAWLLDKGTEAIKFGNLPADIPSLMDIASLITNPKFVKYAAAYGYVFYIDSEGTLRRWNCNKEPADPMPPKLPVNTVGKDKDFFLELPWVERLERFISRGDSVLLIGPSGCGKTEASERVFKKRGQQFLTIDCTPTQTADDLEGRIELVTDEKGGRRTVFLPAAPAVGVERGYGLLFNEADALVPEASFALFSVLNRKPMNILRIGYEGSVTFNPETRIIGTQNTEGRGDMRGLFQRSNQDESFLDRWDQYIVVDYPTPDEEAFILSSTTGLAIAISLNIAKTANAIRGATRAGKIMLSCGIRRTRQIAENLVAGDSISDAWDFALLNRATTEDAKAIKEIMQRVYGKVVIK